MLARTGYKQYEAFAISVAARCSYTSLLSTTLADRIHRTSSTDFTLKARAYVYKMLFRSALIGEFPRGHREKRWADQNSHEPTAFPCGGLHCKIGDLRSRILEFAVLSPVFPINRHLQREEGGAEHAHGVHVLREPSDHVLHVLGDTGTLVEVRGELVHLSRTHVEGEPVPRVGGSGGPSRAQRARLA